MATPPDFLCRALVRRGLPLGFLFAVAMSAATFGTVSTVPGALSDIAMDEGRGVLYAANFPANRVEVISLDPPYALQRPFVVADQPSTVAVSPDGQYLVVGHYASGSPLVSPGVTVLNLATTARKVVPVGAGTTRASVLAVAFAKGSCPGSSSGSNVCAVIVHTGGISLLDPATGALTTPVPVPTGDSCTIASTALPVPWATAPLDIIQASANVSGDGNVVYALVSAGTSNPTFVRYTAWSGSSDPTDPTGKVGLGCLPTSPTLGPAAVSVDQTGANLLAGWALADANLHLLAQFPGTVGKPSVGGHVFDWLNGQIYAQVPVNGQTATSRPLLQIVDTDNLTVREVLQLRENLGGKALLHGDKMYAISESGITVMPVRALSTVHRLQTGQEDLLFPGSACSGGLITQSLDIVDPSGGATDFTLSTTTPGIKFSATSGTTPARIQVIVDSAAFQSQKGTTVATVQIASTLAVNVPAPVRLLINTRDPDQQGTLYDLPGTIVDVLADPVQNRFYALRQDRNQVLVFDGATFSQIGSLRTGNTPVQMAIVSDASQGQVLLVTNDNSQLINVYDLKTLQPLSRVFTPGYYPRSIAATTYNKILTTGRNVARGSIAVITLPDLTFEVPPSIKIYSNTDVDPASVLTASPSGRFVFNPRSDGNVALWDSEAAAFISSRKDLTTLSGAYAALSEDYFVAGNKVFNSAMVQVGQIDALGGATSGATFVDGAGLLSLAPTNGLNGVLERFSVDQLGTVSPLRTAETPLIAATLQAGTIGEAGKATLAFTRTLAPLADGQNMIQLSTSGFTVIPRAFDAAVMPPVIAAITNAADSSSGVSPGSIISLWGTGLSQGKAAASTTPLPKLLGNVCLYANGTPIPMFYVSPGQINAQLPFSVPASANLTISNSGGQSAPFNLKVDPTGPAIFSNSSGGPIIIRTVDGKMITQDTPIHLNEILYIYMTGLGAVTSPINAGDAAPSNPPITTSGFPAITIGGASIFTLWSGLAPGMVGVYQVNAQVPFHHIPTGDKIPFTVTLGGHSTTVIVPVQE